MVELSVWQTYPSADREALDALVACAAGKLRIEKPDTSGDEIVFGAEADDVTTALHACDKKWRDKGLLVPSGRD